MVFCADKNGIKNIAVADIMQGNVFRKSALLIFYNFSVTWFPVSYIVEDSCANLSITSITCLSMSTNLESEPKRVQQWNSFNRDTLAKWKENSLSRRLSQRHIALIWRTLFTSDWINWLLISIDRRIFHRQPKFMIYFERNLTFQSIVLIHIYW